MTTLYNVDPRTFEYLVEKDTEATENPMYSSKTHNEKDRYLYNPNTSSLIAPPRLGENETAVLENGNWVKKIYHLGEYYYQKDGIKVDIVDIGESLPAGCLQTQPPSQFHTTHNGAEWIEDIQLKHSYNSLLIRSKRNEKALCAIDIKSKYEREQTSISHGININNPVAESEYLIVLQYLQDLFNIPAQDGFPWDGPDDPLCAWPVKPDCVLDTRMS